MSMKIPTLKRYPWLFRLVYILLAILFIAVAGAFALKFAVRYAAQGQIKKTFPGARVSVGGSRVAPLRRASLSDVAVSQDGIFHIQIAEITADYSPTSLLQKRISKVTVKEAAMTVTDPKNNIADLARYLRLGPKGDFTVAVLDLQNAKLDVWTKDVGVQAHVSATVATVDPEFPLISALDLQIASLRGGKLLLQDGSLSVDQGAAPGTLSVGEIQYNKAKVTGLKGVVRLKSGVLFLDAFRGEVFKGLVEGHATLSAGFSGEYTASLKFIDLDLKQLVNDFKLAEKFRMSGLIGGEMIVDGRLGVLNVLDGGFALAGVGGTLVITDLKLLENIAARTGQSMDLLVESFRNYHYNNGMVTVVLKDHNLLVDMALRGGAGKRDFNIIVHDFQGRKEGL